MKYFYECQCDLGRKCKLEIDINDSFFRPNECVLTHAKCEWKQIEKEASIAAEKMYDKLAEIKTLIRNRKPFFVAVCPSVSKEIQEIAFMEDVEWPSKPGKEIKHTDYKYLEFLYSDTYEEYVITCTNDLPSHLPELKWEADKMPESKKVLPDWIQRGAKCFWSSELHEIILTDQPEIAIKNLRSGITCHVPAEKLTPAKLTAWTFETGPAVFIDEQKKKWAKCVNYDSTTEDVEWGYFKVNDKCWASFEYVMQNHKQLDGSVCGIWVKQEELK